MTGSSDVARARQGWQAAEGRLYPLAMVDAGLYQRALVLVASIRGTLRSSVSSAEELIGCQSDAAYLVALAGENTETSSVGLSVDDLFGAAAAARDRELAAHDARQARLEAVTSARQSGHEWAEMFALGLGARVPELRVHVASGRAIQTAMSMDSDTGAPVFQVMRVVVDPVTGELLNDIDHDDVHVAASAEAWVEISEDLQRRIVSAV
jgi:hypothetical protein